MTLVIAGHHLQEGIFADITDYEDGLFAVADSNITSGGTVLVSGFKKVVEIPIRVKGLNFLGEYFNGYWGVRYETTCFIAFAGSTLVAQHILNSIKNHLNELYPTHNGEDYKLVMSCEKHKHLKNIDYSDHMFLEQHLNCLLTGELISNVVCHSIEAVLEQAAKHDGMKKRFSAFQAEFILGLQCPVSMQYELYEFHILPDSERLARVEKVPIPKGKIAVIGKRDLFAKEAQTTFDESVSSGKCTSTEMHKFLANAIDSQNEIGIYGIGKPCGLYRLRGKSFSIESQIR